MVDRPSDEDIGSQILGVFMRYKKPTSGVLQRNHFFEVRDGDFQRGINKAVTNNWIIIDPRNRYRYQFTATGSAVGRRGAETAATGSYPSLTAGTHAALGR